MKLEVYKRELTELVLQFEDAYRVFEEFNVMNIKQVDLLLGTIAELEQLSIENPPNDREKKRIRHVLEDCRKFLFKMKNSRDEARH